MVIICAIHTPGLFNNQRWFNSVTFYCLLAIEFKLIWAIVHYDIYIFYLIVYSPPAEAILLHTLGRWFRFGLEKFDIHEISHKKQVAGSCWECVEGFCILVYFVICSTRAQLHTDEEFCKFGVFQRSRILVVISIEHIRRHQSARDPQNVTGHTQNWNKHVNVTF